MSFHTPRRGSTSGSETSSRASSPHFILPSQPRFSPPFRAGSTPPETPSSSQSMFMSLSHKVEFKHGGTSNFSCIFLHEQKPSHKCEVLLKKSVSRGSGGILS